MTMKSSLDRWLLINYSGYPFALNSLILDNGLANLAGSLKAAGKQVEILDYATVSMLERLTPPNLSRMLKSTWNRICPPDGSTPSTWHKALAVARLSCVEAYRTHCLKRLLHEIAMEIVVKIRRDGIEAVGFKLWNGDGIQGSAVIARMIRKECPDVRIFGGGPQVDIFMEHLFGTFDAFDAIAFGEGEDTIRYLAESGNRREMFDGIPNLLYRDDGRIRQTETRVVSNLDDIALPVYDPDVYPTAAGSEKIRIIVIDDSRGCGNNCAFCIHPIKSTANRKMRLKSVSKLADDIELLQRRHNVHTFRFAGSCTPYKLLNDFSAEIVRRKTEIIYASFAHVRSYGTANFETMKKAGCLALFFGVESGSQRVLDAMLKNSKVEDIAPAMRKAMDAGIYTIGSLIFPAPFDDEQSEAQTLALMKSIRPSGLTIQPPLIIPRTDWFNNADKYGVRFRSREKYIEMGMRWKAKNLLPVAFWAPLPVSINGRSFKRVLKKTSDFSRRCEEEGIPTGVADDTYLMSYRAGMDPIEFRNITRMAFFSGDADKVRELVERINSNI